MKLISDMTWSEIRKSAGDGALLLLPTGSTEQHGPHLPVRTDSLLVEAVAHAALESIDRERAGTPVVCAPTLWLGASDHHKTFFALSASEITYVAMLTDVCVSVAEAGFSKLFIVNGHGGNTAPLRVAIAGLRKSSPELLIATADYWSLAAAELRRDRMSPPGGAAHGGEIETSLMMHLAGGSVQIDRMERSVPDVPAGYEIDLIDGGAAAMYAPWNALSEKGHVGDPTVSDEEHGRLFFEAAVNSLAQTLKDFVDFHLT